jgi:putative flippase GtrA
MTAPSVAKATGKPDRKRFVRFCAAGALGFVIQIAVVALLTAVGVHYLVATALAVEAAIITNFIWHRTLTWADRPSADVVGQLLRFNALTAVTSIVGSVMVAAVLVESFALSPILANVIGVAAISVINFIGADRLVFRSAVAIAFVLAASQASFAGSPPPEEATLQAKTVKDFARYVTAVEGRSAQRLANREPFMDFERKSAAEQARILAMLKRGEVVVERDVARDSAAGEIPIDGGLVNHWRGTVFVPNVTLDNLLKVLQEPQTDKHKQEDVLSSRVVSRSGDLQKVYLRLRRTKFVTVVYDTEYDVEYKRLSADLALSNSISTKVVEIENAGTPRERALPEGNDNGYMWKLNSYWRYKQVDGGVLVEIESLTLSRDLPPIIGPLIRPIVTSTARESMTRTLASVRARFSD